MLPVRTVYFWYTTWAEALASCPPHAEHVYTGPDTGDYWWAFAARWTGEGDLVTIEQDVQIHDSVIRQFTECPADWCSFGWEVSPGQMSHWWLGCTKFSAWLQREIPISSLCRPNPPEVCDRCTDVPCHRHLDVIFQPIMDLLEREQPHIHHPPVTHLRAERN